MQRLCQIPYSFFGWKHRLKRYLCTYKIVSERSKHASKSVEKWTKTIPFTVNIPSIQNKQIPGFDLCKFEGVSLFKLSIHTISFSGLYFSGWLCLISASFGLCHSYSGVLMSICLIYVFQLPLIESFIHYPHFVNPSFALFQCNLNYITSIFQKCRKKMNIELSSF